MQSHKGSLHALGPDPVQKLIGKVQTGSGRSGRTAFLGIDGLISLLVGKLRPDIGRKRHLAQPFQNLQEDSLIAEFHDPVSVLFHLGDHSSQLTFAENDLLAHLHFSAWLAEAFPLLIPQIPQKQDLHCTARRTVAQKSGWQHPGIVHNQAVTRLEIIQNVKKMPVGSLARIAVQNQQPGGIPLQQGSLRDQLFRQIIPKVMGL